MCVKWGKNVKGNSYFWYFIRTSGPHADGVVENPMTTRYGFPTSTSASFRCHTFFIVIIIQLIILYSIIIYFLFFSRKPCTAIRFKRHGDAVAVRTRKSFITRKRLMGARAVYWTVGRGHATARMHFAGKKLNRDGNFKIFSFSFRRPLLLLFL